MPENIHEKVVNIFSSHKKQKCKHCCKCDEKVIRNEDGYYYVCINKDENGHNFDAQKVIERLEKIYYIVKIMVVQDYTPSIYNYKVPANSLLEFLLPYTNKEKQGTVIEVGRYNPDELA